MNDTDLAGQLDRSFGDGPAHRPLDQQLAAGRRAARRRTVVTTLAVSTAAAVLAVGGLVLHGGGAPRAVDPAAAPSGVPGGPQPGRSYASSEDPVAYDDEGRLVYADGVEVLDHVDNPLHRTPPRDSDGLALRVGDRTSYWLLDLDRDGYMASSDPAGKNMSSLEEWLAFQTESQGAAPTDGLIELGRDGSVTPGPGASVVEERTGVDVDPSFAPPGAPTAAALVERDGVRWWVLARRLDGGPAEYFPMSFTVGGADMEAFLEHSRQQYGSGEGLR